MFSHIRGGFTKECVEALQWASLCTCVVKSEGLLIKNGVEALQQRPGCSSGHISYPQLEGTPGWVIWTSYSTSCIRPVALVSGHTFTNDLALSGLQKYSPVLHATCDHAASFTQSQVLLTLHELHTLFAV